MVRAPSATSSPASVTRTGALRGRPRSSRAGRRPRRGSSPRTGCAAPVDLERPAALHDRAGLEHDDAVGERERLLLVVRHVDRRDAELALQRADLPPHLQPELRVEVRERLVQEQDVGLERRGRGRARRAAAARRRAGPGTGARPPRPKSSRARAPAATSARAGPSPRPKPRCRARSCAGRARSSGRRGRCARRQGGVR